MLILLSLIACKQPSPLPYVGECAEYPEGVYDFGQIGIGSCLAGPVAMEWLDGGARLAVGNANPFLDFTGGNVVTLDMGAVALDGGTSLTHEVVEGVLGMESFPGDLELVPDRDLLLVTNRLSEEARTRVGEDDLYFASTAAGLEYTEAADGSDHIQLGSDPQPIAYDPESGLAFVLNLTDHTVSVLDVSADPVVIVDAVDEAFLTPGRFYDEDDSGSLVELASLDVYDADLVRDEDWTLFYGEGTARLWLPTADGVYRLTSQGQGWERSALGYELDGPGDTEGVVGEVADPQFWGSSIGNRMLFRDIGTGAIRGALSGDFLGDWAFEDFTLLTGREGEWDAALGGPSPVIFEGETWIFYDGVDETGVGGIGAATSSDDINFERVSDAPLLAAGNGTHDAVRAADPYVVYDTQGAIWRMYYGAWDGDTWTVGHAWSEDLLEWTVSTEPVFAAEDGGNAAAPVITYASGGFRMWTTRGEPGAWTVGLATSADGWRWTDRGEVAAFDGDPSDADPPGVGLQAAAANTWTLYGETVGYPGLVFQAGDIIGVEIGMQVQLSSGARFVPSRAPDAGINGVSPGSWLVDEDLVYLTLTDDAGATRIGAARWNGGEPIFLDEVLLEGESGSFDAAGVSAPVVYAFDGGYQMLYAGASDGAVSIGLATSSDGLTWSTDHEAVFKPGDGWDSVQVLPGSVVVTGDGTLQLWYTGSDGDRTRIGLATSADGRSWTRVSGADDDWFMGEGSPGEFDDSSVRGPSVLRDEDAGLEHLWYAGFDGDTFRLGYASRALDSDDPWERVLDLTTEEARPVLSGLDGSFDSLRALRPVATWSEAEGYRVLYTGRDGVIDRGGLAVGLDPDRLYRAPLDPTAGDLVEFSSHRGDGDEDQTAIPLEVTVEGFTVSGIGGSSLLVDNERGFLYVSLKLGSYIYVIDIRDDSTDTWRDTNYMDVEGLLVAETNSGASGFRGMHIPAGSDWLYAVNDEPESVMLFDLTRVVDDDLAQLYRDSIVGWLTTPRDLDRDEGADTTVSIGPAQVTSRDDVVFVANFNANSVGVYDSRLGNYGSLFAELDLIGENPHALAISPDGSLMAVANYVGDLSRGRSSSSIAIVDVDPGSPTYLETLAWIANE